MFFLGEGCCSECAGAQRNQNQNKLTSSDNKQTLNVGRNALTSLPPEIGRLTALQDLDASRNALSQLPASLCELTGLTVRLFCCCCVLFFMPGRRALTIYRRELI